ncbi:hypothetical protein A3H38_03345 [candidate division WOR-1 bacterium RIFCSPLOWO2_02_FULL_46_20]|uniref:Response regulatory domain-containing protein n=2 Tax=Saganbacteria TaxID=1703751 RepID=A0A1F4RG87_UNCSA|nr:MAG: hypothetical protein A3J44_06950 [candidate division WOR-1 bacterium RIFCSPHIGHO2_02_FULL_45_12]OGC07224.1 MAG: hypothetical protein A3H38_03345 [candidate division WOR-1 bacterium RIFCSPLOWO2_02_FULL_46_20]OGC10004.1 MAG: hypothetical protein A3F86_03745 [candidate division WOR-1 bacterium RIFCSPLOWO2_12_FULL_45_9]
MTKKKILLIDDEKDIIDMVKIRLGVSGSYEVTTTYSGQAGVDQANSQDFDLVITDYNMPDLNGEEVIDAIKKVKPDLPLFLFSIYYDDDETISPAIRAKVDGLVRKPIDYAQLNEMINNL